MARQLKWQMLCSKRQDRGSLLEFLRCYSLTWEYRWKPWALSRPLQGKPRLTSMTARARKPISIARIFRGLSCGFGSDWRLESSMIRSEQQLVRDQEWPSRFRRDGTICGIRWVEIYWFWPVVFANLFGSILAVYPQYGVAWREAERGRALQR